VAADRAQTRAGLADVALEQGDVDELLDGGHCVAMLRDAHGPAVDGRLGGRQQVGGLADLGLGEPGGLLAPRPVEPLDAGRPRVVPAGVLLDELAVDDAAVVPRGLLGLDEQGAQGLPQGHVPVDPNGEVQVGETGADPAQTADGLGVLEAEQPGLGQRVEGQDLRAALLGDLESGQHARVVGAGVLAADHDQLGLVDVLEADRALPMPMVSASATPVDSWHMLEQSGRLLVPYARANSW
jgi:hypothetical protein